MKETKEERKEENNNKKSHKNLHVGEMAQSVKFLLYKYENLSLGFQYTLL